MHVYFVVYLKGKEVHPPQDDRPDQQLGSVTIIF